MHIQNRTQKNDSRSCMKQCFSPYKTPMAMNALVPVLPRAPEDSSRCTLIARSRSIRKAGHEGLSLSSFTIRLRGEMSHWMRPASSWSDMYPSMQLASPVRSVAFELLS
ncbi:hypothetical protein I7I50_06717 [Histoplasma capsulatum G186AR]|uniref:Uncharacterized protein n=1 Tax=Ajellomyces capsulatus TaxID=5037 RepID=A0A8H7YWD2_AJECA|nr:hypothetical protein I7I52_10209 [Histoplasma capsulatum]QSS67588.1 hypothetical protein I7I50_06717 [Histoplasma capsulatum G186AR]